MFIYFLIILQVFLEQGLNSVDDDVMNEASEKLQNLIKSTSTLTAKSELVYRLRYAAFCLFSVVKNSKHFADHYLLIIALYKSNK